MPKAIRPTPPSASPASRTPISTRCSRSHAKGKYLSYQKHIRGRATVDVLPDILAVVLRDLTFPKQMRWDAQLEDGKGEFTFGRPIRWLVFLYGGRVVPFTIGRAAGASSPRVQDITSGAVTYGHRFLATSGRAGRAIKVRTFDEYRKKLTENCVVLSRIERRDRIMRDLEAQARRIGGRAMFSHPQASALPGRSARPRRVPVRRGRRLQCRVPVAAGRSADDDADSPSAFLPRRQHHPAI